MALEVWPFAGLRERHGATLVGAAVVGGRSKSGVIAMANFSGGGFWTAREDCSLRSDAVKLDWNGFIDGCDGGSTPVIVPLKTRITTPADITAIALSANALTRATALSVLVTGGGVLKRGHVFTLDHPAWGPRFYRIESATEQSGGLWSISVRPPLREAAASGTALDIEDPRCVMVLANPDAATVDEDGATVVQARSVEWREHMERVNGAV
ncbi:hypothetical protein ABWI01_03370 [Oceanicaulis alexandrii]|uniref:hypothetical protein n=1 Tax=Oceanicaulis alexandrii TaxID=153233 RepID=UPI0035D0A02C